MCGLLYSNLIQGRAILTYLSCDTKQTKILGGAKCLISFFIFCRIAVSYRCVLIWIKEDLMNQLKFEFWIIFKFKIVNFNMSDKLFRIKTKIIFLFFLLIWSFWNLDTLHQIQLWKNEKTSQSFLNMIFSKKVVSIPKFSRNNP